MNRILCSILLLALSTVCNAIDLKEWKMQREGDRQSYEVTLPCTVAAALNEAGVLGENVLEEDNYLKIDKSLFDSPWIFSTKFDAPKGLRHVLRFEGISYSADIWVNGKQIASADTTFGAFCVREFDITAIAKQHNSLKVRVFKAPKASLNNGYVDWNPRPVDESMGIWRKVELISTPDVQIEDLFVKPLVDVNDLSKAAIQVEATLVNRSNSAVSGTLRGVYDSGQFEKKVNLSAGETKTITLVESIMKPRIWWSHDMGKPELYKAHPQSSGYDYPKI